MDLSAEYITDFSLNRLAGAKVRHGLLRRKRQVDGFWRWCADSARWASSGRHVDHRDRRRVMISM